MNLKVKFCNHACSTKCSCTRPLRDKNSRTFIESKKVCYKEKRESEVSLCMKHFTVKQFIPVSNHPSCIKLKWSTPKENSRLLMNTRLLIGEGTVVIMFKWLKQFSSLSKTY